MESFRSRSFRQLKRGFYPRSYSYKAGFTLIELMVVFAIMIVVSSIILTNQNSFNRTLILANTAYDMALTVRSAQTYGLSSRAVGATANVGYGLDFQKASPTYFTLFADSSPPLGGSPLCHPPPPSDPNGPDALPGDCAYSGASEKIMDYTLGNNIIISDFCAFSSGSWTCAVANNGGLNSLDIIFARPNPDAFISANGVYSSMFPITKICLAITSPQRDAWRYVSVSASGQIIASASSCSPLLP